MTDEHLVQRSELDAIREAAANTPQRDSFADDPRVREPFGDDRDAEVVRFVKDRGRWLAEVLDGLDGFVARHVHFESEAQRTAVVLWVAVTYVADAFDVAPYLHIKSPEKQSGKTLLLEVLEFTAWDALMTSNISPAALFRLMDSRRPTLLFDEIDSVFPSRKGNRDTSREELRDLINSGYRRGAKTLRVGGPRRDKLEEFDSFGPKALAGIGELPDTIADRAIPIRLQRKPRSVTLSRWRRRMVGKEAAEVADRLSLALADLGTLLGEKWPELPEQLSDRAQDLWEPLLAVADYAGGVWPARSRVAAVHLHSGGDQAGETIGVRLLNDSRVVFAEDSALWTETLLKGLHALDESPWGDWYGKAITARFLAERLRPYGIRSQNIRLRGRQKKGYTQASFIESWDRYLPDVPLPVPSQPSQPLPDKGSETESLTSRTRLASVPGDSGTAPGRIGANPKSAETPTPTSDGTEGTAAAAQVKGPTELAATAEPVLNAFPEAEVVE